jgi:hypothetical protein
MPASTGFKYATLSVFISVKDEESSLSTKHPRLPTTSFDK